MRILCVLCLCKPVLHICIDSMNSCVRHIRLVYVDLTAIYLVFNLTFMGPCIVIIFQYISNKIQRYTVYSYLETALHVSGGIITHHQERKQLYLQLLVFVTPLLLPAVIVEEMELVCVCCGYPACKVYLSYYIVICGLADTTIFFNIFS
jgi:hypothetical protein